MQFNEQTHHMLGSVEFDQDMLLIVTSRITEGFPAVNKRGAAASTGPLRLWNPQYSKNTETSQHWQQRIALLDLDQ